MDQSDTPKATNVSLSTIEPLSAQTMIVRAAIEQGLSSIFFVPDLDNPQTGVYVDIPVSLQFTYRCVQCNHIVVANFLRSDVLIGNINLTKNCNATVVNDSGKEVMCSNSMRVKFMGAVMDIPVVEASKKGLELWMPDNGVVQ